MARIRSVKPEFWASEQVMELSPLARLAFIGMWNFCDDGGVHPASAKTLKAEIFPSDDMTTETVGGLVVELVAQSLVREFDHDGKRYWHVTGWAKHQRIEKPTFRHPQPDPAPSIPGALDEHSPNTPGTIGDSSTPERKGVESTGGIPPTDVGGSRQPMADDGIPACPHQQIIALYATHLPNLPQPRLWEGQRAKNLTARWRWVLTAKKPSGERYATSRDEGIAFFDRFFAYVARSDFLTGRNDNWHGCDLAWLVKSESFAKVIEGKYENKEAA